MTACHRRRKSPAKAATKLRHSGETTPRIIRDPLFAKRLEQACDAHSHVPPLHSGRLTWIKRELGSRFDEDIAVETVRKWFAGEAKPRPDKLAKLAQLLEVDTAWLSLGVDPELAPRERKARNAMADGSVNVVAGLIQMDGGHPAFPETPHDVIDLHAIIRGTKYDLHVTLGEQIDNKLRFVLPPNCGEVIVLGLVRDGFDLAIYEITPEVIERGNSRGGSIEVEVKASELKRIESFKTRL